MYKYLFIHSFILSFIEIWASTAVTETKLRDKQSGFRITVDARDFSFLYTIPTGFEVHLVFH